MASSRTIWVLPVLAVALAAAAGAVALRQMDRSLDQLERGFAQHARSVALLVGEGARQSTLALDLVYELGEQALWHAAWRLVQAPTPEARRRAAREEALAAWWSAGPEGDDGEAGDLDGGRVRDLQAQLASVEAGILVEDGAAAALGLYCTGHTDGPRRSIACRDQGELQALRRQTGLRLLLASAVGDGLRYAVLQDADGLLAASPDPPPLSTWPADPALAGALAASAMRFRPLAGTPPLLEGLSPFALPDGSTALLRVGVDATLLQAARAQLSRRQRLLVAALLGLVLVALGATWALQRLDAARRREEQALAAREAEARHWHGIGEMAATVAHEVRNPLNTLGMIGQRLRLEFQVPEADRAEYQQLLGVLHDEAERVERVVGEFLELGKPLQLTRARLPLRALVDEAVAPLALRAPAEGKHLRIELDARTDGEVEVDRARVAQILHNLVGNALDAVSAGGSVRVHAAVAAGALRLVIEDDGPGMDAADLARAQQPFVTSKARGTGLGLPIVRRLVEAHGGTLELHSTRGHGTRAEVLLPAPRG